jgi:hypothetical protein
VVVETKHLTFDVSIWTSDIFGLSAEPPLFFPPSQIPLPRGSSSFIRLTASSTFPHHLKVFVDFIGSLETL